MTAPRILYVHNSADLYGASRSLLRLLPHVQAAGYLPTALLPQPGPLQTRIEALGIETFIDPTLAVIDRARFRSVFGLASWSIAFPRSAMRLWRLLRQGRFNLVHTNTGVMPSPGLAARLAGIPHVWHVRDSFEEFRSLWRFYRGYIGAVADRILCVSNPIAAQFPRNDQVRVLHNGLPLEEFPSDLEELRRQFREEHGLGSHVVVGCVGRIKFVRKGQEVLLQAAAQLKAAGLQAKYAIIGTPAPGNEDHGTRLRQLIRELGLAEDVILPGELADPRPAYAGMDVFVLPSAQPEPFGGVVLEAMAMRRPVVATAIGGSLDQVADGVTGRLVPPADPAALAEALRPLLTDATLRETMGTAGRRRLEERFTIGTMMRQLFEHYRDLGVPAPAGHQSTTEPSASR